MKVSYLILILNIVFMLWLKFRNSAEFGGNTGFFAIATPISGIVIIYLTAQDRRDLLWILVPEEALREVKRYAE